MVEGDAVLAYVLSASDIELMQRAIDSGDAYTYYNLILSRGDFYGSLAQGVVWDDTFSGKIANSFAWSVTNAVNPALAQGNWETTWSKVSSELMQADFAMRLDKYNRGQNDHSLDYREIQQYHNQVFVGNGLPAEAWTAEIILRNHPNPAQWWQKQLSQNGIDNLTAYMDLFNEMAGLSGAEAAAHRHEWYNANGTINDATANSPAWMIENMPVTFWSQHLYSPSGIGAAANGFLEALAGGLTNSLFEARELLGFLSNAIENASDILGNALSQTSAFFGFLVKEYMDAAIENNSTAYGSWHGVDMRFPNDGDVLSWVQLTADYRDFSSKFDDFMKKIEINNEDGRWWVEYKGDLPGKGQTFLISKGLNEVSQEMLNTAIEYFWNFFDPIVLDLDGDGIETIALSNSSSSFFDPSGKVHGWLSANDAFLFVDENNDGIATESSELFGSSSERGFDALKRFDANGDSVLDESDPMFASLRLWRDIDGNGVSSLDEIYTLDQLNIKSLNLGYANEPYLNNGNVVTDISSYEMTDGTRKVMADVWFAAA